MESVPITTDVVGSTPTQGAVYNIMWLAEGRWFSPSPPVSSTNKTDRHDKTEILLRVALSTIKPNQIYQVTQRLKEFAHIGKAYLSQADECKINFKILNHQLYVTM
jgi:hypothetical protein